MKKTILVILTSLMISSVYAGEITGIVHQGFKIDYKRSTIEKINPDQVITCHLPAGVNILDGAITVSFTSTAFTQTQNVTLWDSSPNTHEITFRPYLHLVDSSVSLIDIDLEGSASHNFRVSAPGKTGAATKTTLTCNFTR